MCGYLHDVVWHSASGYSQTLIADSCLQPSPPEQKQKQKGIIYYKFSRQILVKRKEKKLVGFLIRDGQNALIESVNTKIPLTF